MYRATVELTALYYNKVSPHSGRYFFFSAIGHIIK